MKELFERRARPAELRELAPRLPATTGGRTVVIQQARVENIQRWSAPLVLSAIDAHEAGEFTRSAQLAISFGRDDRISACRRTRIQALVGANGADFGIEKADDDTSDALAKRVQAWWFDALPDATLSALFQTFLDMGVVLGRIHWALSDREWRPVRIEPWHAANVRFDQDDQLYYAQTEDDEIAIQPDDPNWLLIGGPGSFMSGAVRALGLAYVMRGFTWRDWSRFNERHGLPILAISEPAGETRMQAAGDPRKKAFYEAVRTMGSTGILRLPQGAGGVGYKLDLIEAKDGSFGTFEEFRKALDVCIAIALLGQNLSTEVQGGSYAAAKAQNLVRGDYLAADAEILSTALRDQLVKRWLRFNVPNAADALAPWPRWKTEPPADRKDEADTADKAATAIATLQKTGMPIDYARLLERLDLPVVEGADPNAAKPPAPEPVAAAAADPKARAPRLKSGASLAANAGFVSGQIYVDDLVDESAKKVARAQAAFLDELAAIVQRGGDYETIRAAVLRHYQDAADPVELRDILAKTLILANLAGQAAVLEDL